MFDTSFISVNSWCGDMILGGCLDLRIVLSRNGGLVMGKPLAVSAQEFMKSVADMPSAMQWFTAIPRTNPPHLNLVTCRSKVQESEITEHELVFRIFSPAFLPNFKILLMIIIQVDQKKKNKELVWLASAVLKVKN